MKTNKPLTIGMVCWRCAAVFWRDAAARTTTPMAQTMARVKPGRLFPAAVSRLTDPFTARGGHEPELFPTPMLLLPASLRLHD